MRARVLLVVAMVGVVLAAVPTGGSAAPRRDMLDKIAVSGTPFLGKARQPQAVSPREASKALAAATTSESQCVDSTDTLVLELFSFDPENPGSQMVVFHRETLESDAGLAKIWVAWDFLAPAWGPPDEVTCDEVAYLAGVADQIVATNVHYFGEYVERPAGNPNIDILVYNIVDELFFDPDVESFIAGFYSPDAQVEFNRNIFFLDSLLWSFGLGPDDPRPFEVEATFAHELEHLIMNDHDPDELSWIDEGLADLAMYLNGFGHDEGHVTYYLAFHRNSLTDWQSGLEDYGASYLFQLYLLENFGSRSNGVWDNAWTRAMVDQQANGVAGVEAQTGMDMADLFDSWIMANLQDTPGVEARAGLPMGYRTIDLNPFVGRYGAWSIRRSIKDIYGANANGNLPISRYYGGATSGSVEYPLGTAAPYSAVYKSYGGSEPRLSIRFRGEVESGLAPTEGTYEAASGMGNMLTDRTLALEVPVGGTLTFKTWFDIEEDWDFGFVEASTDGGSTWVKLVGSVTRTSTNPFGSSAWTAALGDAASTDAAITGASGGWLDAEFALPAASDVLVRFNYFTDEAVNGKGWFIDEVAVNGFADGFESGAPDWDLGGWLITTGLFDNDWVVGYVNPKRTGSVATGYADPTDAGDGYQRSTTMLDTRKLTNHRVVVVFANRPSEDAFDAGYLILVRKKG
jgi:hypothetical protein